MSLAETWSGRRADASWPWRKNKLVAHQTQWVAPQNILAANKILRREQEGEADSWYPANMDQRSSAGRWWFPITPLTLLVWWRRWNCFLWLQAQCGNIVCERAAPGDMWRQVQAGRRELENSVTPKHWLGWSDASMTTWQDWLLFSVPNKWKPSVRLV